MRSKCQTVGVPLGNLNERQKSGESNTEAMERFCKADDVVSQLPMLKG